ncbi:zearalenone lactonase [Hypoxylon trugodes]|uniref:zearalenone lactonase n=1 Tax=Hypoxylon trugodes TaxID=326681 RepID=UPI0021900B2F|nr:zearalenone lactonase [Hypoxylon trugodes]KAI1391735.1 zearalenone lactonase [Hypoxylon trugodes]
MATISRQQFSLPSSRIIDYALWSESSNPNAPVILLSNSLCAPYPTWERVVPEYTSRGFTVIAYSFPGHGGSTTPEDLSSTNFESLADDVQALLNHLSIERLHAWIGVSMGASTGIVFAAKYPSIIQKLVICDTISSSPVNAGTDDVFAPRIAAARKAGKMDDLVEGTMDRWFGRAWVDANPEEANRVRQIMLTTSIDGFETCCAALQSKSYDLRPLTVKAGQSVDEALFIVGDKDANLPESMQELRKGVEQGLQSKGIVSHVDFHVIKNAGHVCYVDGFDEFIAITTQFLKQG